MKKVILEVMQRKPILLDVTDDVWSRLDEHHRQVLLRNLVSTTDAQFHYVPIRYVEDKDDQP